jgi:hypothetical protein
VNRCHKAYCKEKNDTDKVRKASAEEADYKTECDENEGVEAAKRSDELLKCRGKGHYGGFVHDGIEN